MRTKNPQSEVGRFLLQKIRGRINTILYKDLENISVSIKISIKRHYEPPITNRSVTGWQLNDSIGTK